MKEKIFYVYALIDPRDHKFFYIGKGKGKRYASHLRNTNDDSNSHKSNRISEIESASKKVQIKILFSNLDEETALDLEKIIIYKLGRKEFSEGILTNLVPGGNWNRNKSVFYPKTFTESFDLNKLNPIEQKTFLSIKKISDFNYLNTKNQEQIIYKYENDKSDEIAIPLEDFFAGGVTRERIEILNTLRNNELPIYYGYIYSKYPLKDIYLSSKIPYELKDIIDSEFNRKFDRRLKILKNDFLLESIIEKVKRAKIEKKGDTILFTSYYKTGKRKYFRQLTKGQESGKSTYWYENGKIKREQKYRTDGYLEYSKSYYPNGNKESEFSKINGVQIDQEWHENGTLARKFIENIGTVFFDERGIKTNTIWLDGYQPNNQIKIKFE